MCKHCYRVRRGKRHYIYCKQTPKHKQRQGFHTMTMLEMSVNADSMNDEIPCIFLSENNDCLCCSQSEEKGSIMGINGINVNSDMMKVHDIQQPVHNPFRPALGLSSLFLQPPLTMMTDTNSST